MGADNPNVGGNGVATVDPRVERTRATVLDAARRVLLEEGWDAVTHLRVATVSGVSRATIYRHWPAQSRLLHDVLWSEAALSHSRPRGVLRRDLIAELESLQRQLGANPRAGVLAVLIERSFHDEELARVKDSVFGEVSRVVRTTLRSAVEAGELSSALNVDLGVAQLLGPLLYQRLVSDEPLAPAAVGSMVDAFLGSCGPKPAQGPGRR